MRTDRHGKVNWRIFATVRCEHDKPLRASTILAAKSLTGSYTDNVKITARELGYHGTESIVLAQDITWCAKRNNMYYFGGNIT
jgi:hypothetical protein